MTRKRINCILLIDDNRADNEFHRIIIEEMDITNEIHMAENGVEALAYLRKENQTPPELIFLDINMPKMNGWEFLHEYKNLDPAQKAKMTVVMLTTSVNPDDKLRAEATGEVARFTSKPLSEELVNEVLDRYYEGDDNMII